MPTKAFKVVKFIPYGSNRQIGEFETYHEANQTLKKTALSSEEKDIDCTLFILGMIDGEWFALV